LTRPLDGLRVLDLSHMIAGPFASFYLAQMGAEVIKVEQPAGGDLMRSSRSVAGDGTPPGYVAFNAGKRSVAIDFRVKEGADAIRDLAAQADVFIENFRPGTVEKYGLDYPSIAAIKPDIVYCSISGYGQQGEWSQRPAYDYVIQAVSGITMRGGDSEDAPPVKVGFPIVDVATGILGALSISAALHRRSRCGKGQYIDASMVQAALTLLYPDAVSCLNGEPQPPRVGNRGHSQSPASDTFRCADGWLTVTVNTAAQFRKLAAKLGVEALCHDEKAFDVEKFNAPDAGIIRARDDDYVRRSLRSAFEARSASAMEAELNAAGVPCARVRMLPEIIAEIEQGRNIVMDGGTYLQGNQRWIKTTGLGYQDAFDGDLPAAGAEALGQSTEEILSRVGIGAERIRLMAEQGVVKLA